MLPANSRANTIPASAAARGVSSLACVSSWRAPDAAIARV
jgi:hypothetical protein